MKPQIAGKETRGLLSFVHILRLMRIELGIAQSESDEVDSCLLSLTEYEWARRLLTYRGYGENHTPGQTPPAQPAERPVRPTGDDPKEV